MSASCRITATYSTFTRLENLLKFLSDYSSYSINKAFTPINRGKRLIYFVSNVTCKHGDQAGTGNRLDTEENSQQTNSREQGAGQTEDTKTQSIEEGNQAGNTGTEIELDRAQAIAAEHAGFTVSEVQFSKTKLEKEHGGAIYEIEFYKDGMEYEYEIDAVTGDIIEFDSEWDD